MQEGFIIHEIISLQEEMVVWSRLMKRKLLSKDGQAPGRQLNMAASIFQGNPGRLEGRAQVNVYLPLFASSEEHKRKSTTTRLN